MPSRTFYVMTHEGQTFIHFTDYRYGPFIDIEAAERAAINTASDAFDRFGLRTNVVVIYPDGTRQNVWGMSPT